MHVLVVSRVGGGEGEGETQVDGAKKPRWGAQAVKQWGLDPCIDQLVILLFFYPSHVSSFVFHNNIMRVHNLCVPFSSWTLTRFSAPKMSRGHTG